MPPLDDVLQTAQTYLNDFGQTFLEKNYLIQLAKEAIRELQLELNVNGVPLISKQSNPITVLIGSSDLGISQPSDIVEPLVLQEKTHGLNEDYVPMTGPRTFLPLLSQPHNNLVYWSWSGGRIWFPSVGALTDRDVIIQYYASIPLPQADDDSYTLDFPNADYFVAAKIAELVCASLDDEGGRIKFAGMAAERLQKIIQSNIRTQQALPVRRLPYR